MHFRQIRASDLHPREPPGRGRRGQLAGQPAAFAIHSQVHAARPDVGRRRPHPLGVRQGVVDARPPARPDHPGRLRLLRATTPCSTTTPASCSTSRRASASPTPSATTRPPSCATTACSPSATPSTRRPGGSSPWSAPARPQLLARGRRRAGAHRRRDGPPHRDQVGSHLAGWFSFQPLYDWIVRRPARPLGLTVGTAPVLDRRRSSCAGLGTAPWTGPCASASSSPRSTRSGRTRPSPSSATSS